mmetsp:Transcript_7439/g.19219  ORF Transcript_7439/g.19219 Transcript_7439/m.19219 type:complete len:379 (+) Transcript_7439:1948-3084(+)
MALATSALYAASCAASALSGEAPCTAWLLASAASTEATAAAMANSMRLASLLASAAPSSPPPRAPRPRPRPCPLTSPSKCPLRASTSARNDSPAPSASPATVRAMRAMSACSARTAASISSAMAASWRASSARSSPSSASAEALPMRSMAAAATAADSAVSTWDAVCCRSSTWRRISWLPLAGVPALPAPLDTPIRRSASVPSAASSCSAISLSVPLRGMSAMSVCKIAAAALISACRPRSSISNSAAWRCSKCASSAAVQSLGADVWDPSSSVTVCTARCIRSAICRVASRSRSCSSLPANREEPRDLAADVPCTTTACCPLSLSCSMELVGLPFRIACTSAWMSSTNWSRCAAKFSGISVPKLSAIAMAISVSRSS